MVSVCLVLQETACFPEWLCILHSLQHGRQVLLGEACSPGEIRRKGFPSYTDIIALGPRLMTSFNLNFLFKDLISQYIHIGKYWELEIQHMTFGMTKFSP